MSKPGDITTLLTAIGDGDPERLSRLFETVYSELRRLARSRRRNWSGDYTLNTTALIHEAYLKLVRAQDAEYQNRAHFFAVAARAMRQILVNYSEQRRAAKRGGGAEHVSAEDADLVSEDAIEEVLAIHQALHKLAQLSERQAQVVECRFFGGLQVEETAEALGVSAITVKRDWRVASAWLNRELRDSGHSAAAERRLPVNN